MKGLGTFKDIKFLKRVKNLIINACEIQEEHIEHVYSQLEAMILRFENIEELKLTGMRIGDHL